MANSKVQEGVVLGKKEEEKKNAKGNPTKF